MPADRREEFLDHIRMLVDHWDWAPDKTGRQKLEGLAHSICALLDGCTDVGAFTVAPSRGGRSTKGNIAGCLNELLWRRQ